MTRTVRNGPVPKIIQAAHQYLFARDEAARAEKTKKPLGKELKDYVAANGEETPDGHVEWAFPKPLTIGGVTYTGLRNQKSQGDPLLDEDRAEVLLKQLNLRDRVAKEVMVVVWDWDELYVLNQQGLISDEQLDSLFDVQEPTWSLVVVK